MCRHLYDPIQAERKHGRRPGWLKKLRELQGKLDSKGRGADRGVPVGAASDEVVDVCYDGSKRIALRWKRGMKTPEPTDVIYTKPKCTFAFARWDDGYEHELDSLTAAAWNGQDAAAADNDNSEKGPVYSAMFGSIKIGVFRKMLDKNNPGMVIKFDNSQKLQMAYKVLPEQECGQWMTQVAKDICSGEITLEQAKVKKEALDNECNERHPKMKRPAAAMKRPASMRRPSASDGGDDQDDKEINGDGAEEEEGYEELDHEADEEVDVDGENEIMKKPAAARKPSCFVTSKDSYGEDEEPEDEAYEAETEK